LHPEKENIVTPKMPDNHYRADVLSSSRWVVPPETLAQVQKVTMPDRVAFLKAVKGGWRASDEVKKLQSQGLRPFDTLQEIQWAHKKNRLTSLPSIDEGRRFYVDPGIGETDPSHQEWYNLINPEAYADFNKYVADMFYAHTGKLLVVTSLVRSAEYQKLLTRGNIQATQNVSPHSFGRTIDFSLTRVYNPETARVETLADTSPERQFISRLLTHYEKNYPEWTSWLVENGNCYHWTFYRPIK
jgi:hypothetical protein